MPKEQFEESKERPIDPLQGIKDKLNGLKDISQERAAIRGKIVGEVADMIYGNKQLGEMVQKETRDVYAGYLEAEKGEELRSVKSIETFADTINAEEAALATLKGEVAQLEEELGTTDEIKEVKQQIAGQAEELKTKRSQLAEMQKAASQELTSLRARHEEFVRVQEKAGKYGLDFAISTVLQAYKESKEPGDQKYKEYVEKVVDWGVFRQEVLEELKRREEELKRREEEKLRQEAQEEYSLKLDKAEKEIIDDEFFLTNVETKLAALPNELNSSFTDIEKKIAAFREKAQKPKKKLEGKLKPFLGGSKAMAGAKQKAENLLKDLEDEKESISKEVFETYETARKFIINNRDVLDPTSMDGRVKVISYENQVKGPVFVKRDDKFTAIALDKGPLTERREALLHRIETLAKQKQVLFEKLDNFGFFSKYDERYTKIREGLEEIIGGDEIFGFKRKIRYAFQSSK